MTKAKKITLLVAAVVIIALMVVAGVTQKGDINGTFWSLFPPVVAIGLALITKEVYSSLFIGILSGALLYSNFSFTGTMDTVINDGLIAAVSGNAGIFIFLVELGVIVALVSHAGAAEAFGRWAEKHIKTKVGAMLATFALGVLIFIDDYFNCLTVGSVMSPITDSKKISRAKLAYIIDATAAPVCMIAPISSWAAAVSGNVEGTPIAESMSPIELFVRAIPFNFYSLLTLVFIIAIAVMGFDYGKMSEFEIKAQKGDLGVISTAKNETDKNERGSVLDIIIPIVVLIVSCVLALMKEGGFFNPEESEYYHNFAQAFGNTDATVGLPWGGLVSLIIIIAYLLCRRHLSFKKAMDAIPQGFIAMVPAILILTFANALKNTTSLLGSTTFVENVMANAGGIVELLPAIIFLVACFIAFATGTSWGTFGILIPIVLGVFTDPADPLLFVGISACLAGAVCGDHCSPISDTTIMASAGAQCNHLDHVSSQLPYAITVAAISFVMFLFAGYVPNAWIALPVGIVLTVATLVVIKLITKKKNTDIAE
ncbi:MAG: Na+/H+ antiporter NhaC family protein [Ruminococcaceae bacterium]|nr:Na+/H+ antiporter NhaC family protein [Oscillospiraceae bacterium]